MDKLRKIIREQVKTLLEIDWEGDFKDVNKQCISPSILVKFLNDELDRINHNKEITSQKDRISRKTRDVIVTRGNIEQLFDGDQKIDLDRFIDNITKTPETIFDQNDKMEKSDIGRPQMTINTGLPAIVAIVYDKDSKQFFKVNTCPGAGECIIGCYARKAFYGMDDSKTIKLTQRLNFLLNDPKGFKEMLMRELIEKAEKLKKSSVGKREKKRLVIRWNDAGDFFTDKYFKIATEATKELNKAGYNVYSYAYTKGSKYVLATADDEDFTMNFSTGANKKELSNIDVNTAKIAVTVPKDLFDGIFLKKGPHYEKSDYDGSVMFVSDKSSEELKKRIFDKYKNEYNLKYDSIIFVDELPHQEGKRGEYNVIVLPSGDSDISAQRRDVRVTFLLQH